MKKALLLTLVICSFAAKADESLKKAVKGLSIYRGAEVLLFDDKKYLVAIGDADIKSNKPIDIINAMKIAKAISRASMSKFVHGEAISVQEKTIDIQITKYSNNKAVIVKNDSIYEEIMTAKSSGILRNTQEFKWQNDAVYYVATLIKFNDEDI